MTKLAIIWGFNGECVDVIWTPCSQKMARGSYQTEKAHLKCFSHPHWVSLCFQCCRKAPCRRDLHQWRELLPQATGNQRLCRQAQGWTSQKRVGCPSFLLLLLQFQKPLKAYLPTCVWFHHDKRDRELINFFLCHLFFPSFAFFFFFFLMFLVVVQKINHLNFLHCVDWCVTTLSDDCVWHKACKQMTNQSSPIKETQIITDQTMIKNDDFFFWRTLHCRSKFSSNGTLCYAHVYVLRSETDKRGAAFSRRHVDGSFTSDVNKVLDSLAAKEYLLWVMTSKPSGER